MLFINYCSFNRIEDFKSLNLGEGIFPITILFPRIKLFPKFDNWVADTLTNSFSSGFMTLWKHLI